MLVVGLASLAPPAAALPPERAEKEHGHLGVMLSEKKGTVRILEVVEGSAADKAGLEEGDVIVEVDGRKVEGASDVVDRIRDLDAGQSLRLKVSRDGQAVEKVAVLDEKRPFHHPFPGKALGKMRILGLGAPKVRLGVELQPLTAGLRGYFRVAGDQGVLVADVVSGSPAEKAGLRAGDVILALQGKAVADPGDLIEGLRELKAGDRVTLRVVREGAEQTFDVTLEERPEGELGQGLPCLPGFPMRGMHGMGDLEELEGLSPEIERTIERALEKAREEVESIESSPKRERVMIRKRVVGI
jgi:predicted metalloprotease with PDZ domain